MRCRGADMVDAGSKGAASACSVLIVMMLYGFDISNARMDGSR